MHLLIDLDNTIVDTSKAMFDFCEATTGIGVHGYTYDCSKVTWDMTKLLPHLTKEQIGNMFCNENFFNHLEMLPFAHEVLTVLKQMGHTIEIVSCHKVEGMDLKRAWIEKNLKMVDKITLIPMEHSGSSFDKSGIQGDVFIDDRLDALASSNVRFKFLYGEYDWNKEGNDNIRLFDWLDVLKFINSINELVNIEDWGGLLAFEDWSDLS